MPSRPAFNALCADYEHFASEEIDPINFLLEIDFSDLKEAMDNKDVEKIYSEVDSINEKKYTKYLQAEMTDATRLAQSLSRKQYQQKIILDMDQKTISEVRRYHKAPPVLHKVMQGALLLLGEDEGATSVRRHINKYKSNH